MSARTPDSPGPGRPTGSGPFGAPTKVMRVPEPLVPRVVAYLDTYRQAARGRTIAATPAALQPRRQPLPRFTTKIPAGFPSPADDYLEDGCDLNELMVRNAPATFFYTVAGDSLDRAGIFDGDRVVVDRSIEARERDIIIAVIPGEGHTIKRLAIRGGRPVLMPDSHNPAHKPREIREDEELIVWGVVTGMVRQFRR